MSVMRSRKNTAAIAWRRAIKIQDTNKEAVGGGVYLHVVDKDLLIDYRSDHVSPKVVWQHILDEEAQ